MNDTFAANKCIEPKFSPHTRLLYNLSSVPEGWAPNGWHETRDGRVVPDDHESDEGGSWRIFWDADAVDDLIDEKEFPTYPSSEDLEKVKAAFKLFPVPDRSDYEKGVEAFPLATCEGCGRVGTFQGQCPGNEPRCGNLIWPGESQKERGVEEVMPIQPAQEYGLEDDEEDDEEDENLKSGPSADASPLVPRMLPFSRRCDAAALAEAAKAEDEADEDAVLVEAFEKHLGAEKAYNTYRRSRKHKDWLSFDAFPFDNRIDAVKGAIAYGADDKIQHFEILVGLLEDKIRMQANAADAEKMSMQRTLFKFEDFVENSNKRRRKEMDEAELDCAAFKATASQLLAFVSERA